MRATIPAGLVALAAAIVVGAAGLQAEAGAAWAAHAGWCLGGGPAEAALNSLGPSLLGHCALCWAAAALAGVGGALLAASAPSSPASVA